MNYHLKSADLADRVDRVLSVVVIALVGLIGGALVLVAQFKT